MAAVRYWLLALAIGLLLVGACTRPEPTPTTTPTSSPTPSPTLTPTPSPTPTPAPTPTPTPTATPTPTPIPTPTLAPPTPTPTPIVNRTTHGRIRWNETWTGKIRITGDIIVYEGATLTIEPGTTVLIAANQDVGNLFTEPSSWVKRGISPVDTFEVQRGEPYYDEGHHITIRIHGTLHAVGTPEKMITITSDSPTPGIYDWNIFQIDHGILSYSIVGYARAVVFSAHSTGPTVVSHNILRHMGGTAVGFMNSGPAVVEHNTMSDAGHELIDMHNSSPVIRNNHIGPNPPHTNPGGYVGGGVGIIIDGGSPQIIGNTIQGCDSGITFISPPGNPIIEGNIFLNNRKDVTHQY